MVSEIFWAVFAVTAAAALSWWFLGMLLRPESKKAGETLVVIPGRGDGLRLEQTVRLWVWLQGLGLWSGEIVIADLDLTPEGRELALHLTLRWDQVVLRPADGMMDCMERIYQ